MKDSILLKNKRLKYTSYKLIDMVKEKINIATLDDICTKCSVDKDILEKILQYPQIINLSMYKVIGKILEMSIEELTQFEEYEVIPNFRKDKDTEIVDIENLIKEADLIFEEIIINSKLRGV